MHGGNKDMLEERQLSLLGPDELGSGERKVAYRDHLVFREPDSRGLYMGNQRLDEYLLESGIRAPIVVAEILSEQNWQGFEKRYKRGGRAPYSPRLMMGLILYGLMRGVDSLRQLEELARTDLGCIWVTGGIKPDHSVIGRFVNLHQKQIRGRFFEKLTKAVLRRTRSGGSAVAGDGTIIQAAASRLKTLTKEALEQRLARNEEKQRNDPDDPDAQQRVEQTKKALDVATKRSAYRESRGRDGSKTRVSPTEPEAVVQKLKNRSYAPAYKPSILANESRVVLGYALDATLEAKKVPQMLEMSESISEEKVSTLMLDAGYNTNAILHLAVEQDINLLCPEGSADGLDGKLTRQRKLFDKGEFSYDYGSDTYLCPAGQTLHKEGYYTGNENDPGWTRYKTAACEGCALRAKCTKSKHGRQIKRYAEDDAREALREVMQQPGAQRQYRKRQAWVESVFSQLRGTQRFQRFRRRGQASATLELALRLAAYNLSRAVVRASAEALAAASGLLSALIVIFLPTGFTNSRSEQNPKQRTMTQGFSASRMLPA